MKNNPMTGMRDMMKSMFRMPLSMAEMSTRGMTGMMGASEKDETSANDMLDNMFEAGERMIDGSVDLMFAPFTGQLPDWSEMMGGSDKDEDDKTS